MTDIFDEETYYDDLACWFSRFSNAELTVSETHHFLTDWQLIDWGEELVINHPELMSAHHEMQLISDQNKWVVYIQPTYFLGRPNFNPRFTDTINKAFAEAPVFRCKDGFNFKYVVDYLNEHLPQLEGEEHPALNAFSHLINSPLWPLSIWDQGEDFRATSEIYDYTFTYTDSRSIYNPAGDNFLKGLVELVNGERGVAEFNKLCGKHDLIMDRLMDFFHHRSDKKPLHNFFKTLLDQGEHLNYLAFKKILMYVLMEHPTEFSELFKNEFNRTHALNEVATKLQTTGCKEQFYSAYILLDNWDCTQLSKAVKFREVSNTNYFEFIKDLLEKDRINFPEVDSDKRLYPDDPLDLGETMNQMFVEKYQDYFEQNTGGASENTGLKAAIDQSL